jgi:hypothetical protein
MQLVERHGARGWVDALMVDAGPPLMIQLEDMANFLERVERYVVPSMLLMHELRSCTSQLARKDD